MATITIPLWVLLGFAAWTLLTLFTTVGIYRWSRILTGRAAISEFPADRPHGADWYRRALRAHANCVENLPVYTAIAVVTVATGIHSPVLDRLAIILLLARIGQTLVHVGFQQTDRVVSVRFTFFLIQVLCMVGMGITVATSV
jgi:uncharacterized MAPEG superfamily protein